MSKLSAYRRGRTLSLLLDVPLAPASVINALPSAPSRMALINVCSIFNKPFILNGLFCSKILYFMFVMETWQQEMIFIHFNKLCPPKYSFVSTAQLSGHGGGVKMVHRMKFPCQQVSTTIHHSCNCLKLSTEFSVLYFKW